MSMSSAKSQLNAGGNRRKKISLPDMGPFAGVFFLLVYFSASTTHTKQPSNGIVAVDELPRSKVHFCLRDNTEAIIGLDTSGRYSFAVTGPVLQAATLKEVSVKHGIYLSTAQLARLQTLDFLATDISQLPVALSLPAYRRLGAKAKAADMPLGESQLVECLKAAQSVVLALTYKPIYVHLLINAETRAVRVMQLMEVLQEQGVNSFNLKTQTE